MKDIKIEDILKICNGELLAGKKYINVIDFSKDTRSIKEGDFYIAIKGDSVNGNNFVEQALGNGAIGCLVDEGINKKILEKYNDRAIVKVEDTIQALQQIAKYKRSLYNIPVIAVTGSVRKNEY